MFPVIELFLVELPLTFELSYLLCVLTQSCTLRPFLENKKFELMRTRCTKAYISFGSVV